MESSGLPYGTTQREHAYNFCSPFTGQLALVPRLFQHVASLACVRPPAEHTTGKGSINGWRTPLNKIKYSEQRDEETGFSYFGARYYDSDLSGLFLSVDPMSDKYPSISPYAYCAWNPVKLVDPDGMDTIVTIGLNNGNVNFWCDDKSHNGTFVDLVDVDNRTSRYLCTGSVSFSNETKYGRTTVSFTNDNDANEVFDRLTGINELNIESKVEWNYYQQRSGSGDLLTSHLKDEINVTGLDKRYNNKNTLSLHHFHPSTPGSAWWTPSLEDQSYSMTLDVPCFLHFKKQNYQFDDIVHTYGIMDYYQFQGHVPYTIIK